MSQDAADVNHTPPRTAPAPAEQVLAARQWQDAAAAHAQRAQALLSRWSQAHAQGRKHPVEDFLVEYYMIRPSRLRRWHPGVGTALEDAGSWLTEDAYRQWYRRDEDGLVRVDAQAFVTARSRNLELIEALLTAVTRSSPRFSCFGLHEWAMVYRQEEHRHPLPLRLGQEGTDAVVEHHTIACSHYDAYRFFTPAATALNTLQPTREEVCRNEQAGCLHAGMDLYKYAARLGPLCPGDLLLDTLELARDARWLDMEASPYDLTPMGHTNVPIETPAGKEVYVRRQRQLAGRAHQLRVRLLDVIAAARAAGSGPCPPSPH